MIMNIFTKQIVEVLNIHSDVESLYLNINKIYEEIQVAQPWLEPFTIKIYKTTNHLEFYYYCAAVHAKQIKRYYRIFT